MAERTPPRPGKAPPPKRPARTRRSEIRRTVPKPRRSLRDWATSPEFARSAPIGLVFMALAGLLIAWAREQPYVAPGRVMTDTRVVRAEFQVPDLGGAETRRSVARQTAPRVYIASRGAFEEIQSALVRLPTALADAASLEEVAPEMRETYQLDENQLAAIRSYAVAGEASRAWQARVESLTEQLRTLPILDRDIFQIEQTAANQWIEVRFWDGETERLLKGRAVNVAGAQLRTAMRQAVSQAGFEEPVASVIVNWLVENARPTFRFDETATEEVREAAAAEIEPEMITYSAGRVIYRRGEILSQEQYDLLLAEHRAFPGAAPPVRVWAPRAAAVGIALLATLGMAAYVGLFYPRVTRNPWRVTAIAGLTLAALAAGVWMAAASPRLTLLALAAPPLFCAVILVIAYDQRMAMGMGLMIATVVGVALARPLALLLVPMLGVGAAVWQLREVRHRNDLIRAGLAAGVVMALTAALVATARRPIGPEMWIETVWDAGRILIGSLAVGGLALMILPTIEKVFDITTGMTLIELRDPKHPLLRQLQQRAPGTYNHSLTVAAIAESAAEAIGADPLHAYVGALYHDIGKMNKPDYFVENQLGGVNRHSRLSPAMSLLVIVGHVKDGVELAREYNLPRSLHHYIESHHGTTLVEYFYHRAREKADQTETATPSEVEYRYPGPKPRTKEAAILMLADAVESSMRSMAEPTPARIEQQVRALAGRRLTDGQFDDCDMTLRELHTIEQSIIKSMNSIYHGRIAYPGGGAAKGEPQRPAPAAPTTTPAQPAPAG